jgi:hypothetical protein
MVGQAVWPVDSVKDDRRNRLSYLMVARLAKNLSGIGRKRLRHMRLE